LSTLEQLVAEAIRLSADALDVEYKDQHEEVAAMRGPAGVGIASLPSSSPEAEDLRRELYGIAKKRRRMRVGEVEYELRVRIYDSFGEDAFSVQFRRL
jgi:hypothetical protein